MDSSLKRTVSAFLRLLRKTEELPLRNKGLLGLLLVLALPICLYMTIDYIKGRRESFSCGDGPRRTIDSRKFLTRFDGYAGELEAHYGGTASLSAKLTEIQIRQLSDATMSAHQFRLYVVEGFNSCAISKQEFAQFGLWIEQLNSLERELDSLLKKSALSADDRQTLDKLTDEYITAAKNLSKSVPSLTN